MTDMLQIVWVVWPVSERHHSWVSTPRTFRASCKFLMSLLERGGQSNLEEAFTQKLFSSFFQSLILFFFFFFIPPSSFFHRSTIFDSFHFLIADINYKLWIYYRLGLWIFICTFRNVATLLSLFESVKSWKSCSCLARCLFSLAKITWGEQRALLRIHCEHFC